MNNPWYDLPTTSPYVLPCDKSAVDLHRHASSVLRLDTLPEPFIGGLNKAEVVFLALNPGFAESDITVNMASRKFIEANRNNQKDPYNSPFYYFDGGLEETGGYWWWKKQLKPLISAGVNEAAIRDKIMVIEYFPYHSIKAGKIKHLSVPSQRFSFDLVREAITLKKIIVIMRSRSLWLDAQAVPELAAYPYMTLNSPQNVIVSPTNLGEENFEVVRAKLASSKSRIISAEGEL